ncbi:MAG: DUF1003 domain-containing protein [Planctomycetaceae bacterium]|nr:DUF1003 domain-containing protein [Planctomycetaceae bacterium]
MRKPISELIHHEHANWTDGSYICRTDLARYRSKYVHSLLESEKGELSQLDREILVALQNQELISSNIENEFEKTYTPGEKLADIIATWGGSWSFLIVFALFMIFWVTINSLAAFWQPVDPYPYILLNLLLSCLAAIQAPIIIMSQNRQEAKDRIRAQHDYQINLKAELEIKLVHEKLDHLLTRQWEKLMQIQELQIEQLSEIDNIKKRST